MSSPIIEATGVTQKAETIFCSSTRPSR